jgi:hypothetical protein
MEATEHDKRLSRKLGPNKDVRRRCFASMRTGKPDIFVNVIGSGHTSTISIVLTRLAPPRCTITSEARMRQAAPAIPASLDELENSTERGYPASDAACIKSWKKLKSDVGTAPHELLEAAPRKLAAALKPGGSPATCIFVTERFSDFRKTAMHSNLFTPNRSELTLRSRLITLQPRCRA